MKGRVTGTVEGDNYVFRQGGVVLRSVPLSEIAGRKFDKATKRNGWERPE